MSNFAKLFDRYKTYDDSEGRGSVEEWRGAFNTKMNLDEAKGLVRDNDPLVIIGLDKMPSLATLKNVYRKLMMKHHPDRGGDVIVCRSIIAAFTILERRAKD